MKSNGRASGTTNLFFENGHVDYKNLLNSSKEIIYINETFGGGVNIITGDYLWVHLAHKVENGEFIYPIRNHIAGNLNEILIKWFWGMIWS